MVLSDHEQILGAAECALVAGAQILDVGAESTRPGADPIDFVEEERRLLPAPARATRSFPPGDSVDRYDQA